MRLQFTGTGAADWGPQFFTDGKEYRRFSSALVDGILMIDPGPHIFHFAEKNGTPEMYDNAEYIIVTHSHRDHFCPQTVAKLCGKKPRTLYGSPLCLKDILKEYPDGIKGLKFFPVFPGCVFEAGDFTVRAFQSNHATDHIDELTLNYVVEKGEKRFFYGLDSGWIYYPVWRVLRTMKYDAVIFEGTVGDVLGDDRIFGHNNTEMVKIMKQTFIAQGCMKEGSKFYISHLARTLHGSQSDVEAKMLPFGIIPAHDGLTISI